MLGGGGGGGGGGCKWLLYPLKSSNQKLRQVPECLCLKTLEVVSLKSLRVLCSVIDDIEVCVL